MELERPWSRLFIGRPCRCRGGDISLVAPIFPELELASKSSRRFATVFLLCCPRRRALRSVEGVAMARRVRRVSTASTRYLEREQERSCVRVRVHRVLHVLTGEAVAVLPRARRRRRGICVDGGRKTTMLAFGPHASVGVREGERRSLLGRPSAHAGGRERGREGEGGAGRLGQKEGEGGNEPEFSFSISNSFSISFLISIWFKSNSNSYLNSNP